MNDKESKDQPFHGKHSASDQAGKADSALFSGFEEEGEYEEPDRDTDYTSIYREDGIEDEEFADTLFEEEDDPEPGEIDLWAAGKEPADGIESLIEDGDEDEDEDEKFGARITFTESVEPAEDTAESEAPGAQGFNGERDWEEEDNWDESDEYYAEEPDSAEQQSWPLSLIAVAVIALLLVMAGGYGVIQQRSATQEELRQLRAALATSVSQDDVAQSRGALEEATQKNQQLQSLIDALTMENRRLTDTVAGLETQLEAQQSALDTKQAAPLNQAGARPAAEPAPAPEPAVKAAPEPTPAPAPEVPAQPAKATVPAPVQPAPGLTEKTVAASASTGWFVNFASYGVEATARSWVAKLDPSAGRAVIATGTKNGRTFYRVRVIDLPSRESADQVARELAEKHRLPELWVGRQQ